MAKSSLALDRNRKRSEPVLQMLEQGPPAENRHVEILKEFLQHWLDVKGSSQNQKQVLKKWLQENDTKLKMIVPNTLSEIRTLSQNDKCSQNQNTILCKDIASVRRIIARYHYGKSFLQPFQQERAFLEAFLN